MRASPIRNEPAGEQCNAGIIKAMKVPTGKRSSNKPGSFILVHINFDAREKEDIYQELRPARTEGMPRAVFIKGWMMEMYRCMHM